MPETAALCPMVLQRPDDSEICAARAAAARPRLMATAGRRLRRRQPPPRVSHRLREARAKPSHQRTPLCGNEATCTGAAWLSIWQASGRHGPVPGRPLSQMREGQRRHPIAK